MEAKLILLCFVLETKKKAGLWWDIPWELMQY